MYLKIFDDLNELKSFLLANISFKMFSFNLRLGQFLLRTLIYGFNESNILSLQFYLLMNIIFLQERFDKNTFLIILKHFQIF
jgi:hypothetical protein